MSREIKIGDTVKYSAKFLKSAGICTGDICFAEGKVTRLYDKGELHLRKLAGKIQTFQRQSMSKI